MASGMYVKKDSVLNLIMNLSSKCSAIKGKYFDMDGAVYLLGKISESVCEMAADRIDKQNLNNLAQDLRNAANYFPAFIKIMDNGVVKLTSEMVLAAADCIDLLQSELKESVNEMCILCGDYKMEHIGACSDCKWRGMR